MSNSQSSSDIVTTLKQSVEGLYFPSESDYPFEVSLLPHQPPDRQTFTSEDLLRIRGQADSAEAAEVETVALDDFFAPVTQETDKTDAGQTTTQRFQVLLQQIKALLEQVTVYRVGSVEIDVYIVGRVKEETSSRDWVLLSTKVVET
jgi:hypothetical protein